MPWIVPVIASSLWGAGIFVVTLAMLNYVVDSYQSYSASAIAGANVVRNGLGAVFPLFTLQMYQRLGIHWASSVFAFLSLGLLPVPWLLFRYGPKLRERVKI